MPALTDVVDFFLKLEGPYRWYVIAGILVILTAFITRFVFKTLKWFLIIVSVAILIVAGITYLTDIDLLLLLQ